MFDESRIHIYDYLRSLFKGVVTDNYYEMEEPTENNDDDIANGFVFVKVGEIVDFSEFPRTTLAEVRCFIYAFVPKLKRGRLNRELYGVFENKINTAVNNAIDDVSDTGYSILADSILSLDDTDTGQQENQFNIFAKSFIVTFNNQE